MWLMFKEWFNRNTVFLTMIFLSSLTIGAGVAALCAAFPAILPVFAGLTLFEVVPLAFLTALSAPLATLALGLITTAISSVIIAASIFSMKQLTTIGSQVYSLFKLNEPLKVEPLSEASYDFLNKYLHKPVAEHFDDVDDDEFHELSSDSSEGEHVRFIPVAHQDLRQNLNDPVESDTESDSMSLR